MTAAFAYVPTLFATMLLLAVAGTTPPSPDAAAENALRDAVRTLAAERQGVTAFHRHTDAEQRAPGHDASLDIQAGLLRDGDRIVAVKVYSQVANGKTASAADLAKAQADADKQAPKDDYWLPIRESQIPDYRITTTTCDKCQAGNVAIAFTSLKRDANHGDGTLVIDPVTHHFVRIDFTPNALPKHVDQNTVSMTFGRVLPDLYDVVEMRQHYVGHVLFISGGADITTTLTNYRRFSSRDEGLKALAAGI